jgi:arylsulfatase A-like enzyme
VHDSVWACPSVRHKHGVLVWIAPMLLSWAAGLSCSAPDVVRLSPDTNVVLIVVDTLRADRLGSYGFDLDVSPELDAMAEKGVRFHRAIAPSSWTRPSHGSLFTGQHPRTLGLYELPRERLAERFETLAEIFQSRGHTTIGAVANPIVNTTYGFGQGFDHYVDSGKVFQWMQGGGVAARESEFPSAPEIFDRVLEVLGDAPAPPYYIQLNLMEMHFPGPRLRPEYQSLYHDVEGPPIVVHYLRALRQTSHDIGAFVKTLSSRPGFEDTLFVITSDHGEGLADHPGIEGGEAHGLLLYESQLWVPLIFFHTRDAIGNATITRPVRLLDVMPTIVDLVGLPLPPALDGRSLVPAFSDPAADLDLPERFVSETQFESADKIAVYDASWKYIENREASGGFVHKELQAMGRPERGESTSEVLSHFEITEELAHYLEEWEDRHPRAVPEHTTGEQVEGEKQMLRALGYIE